MIELKQLAIKDTSELLAIYGKRGASLLTQLGKSTQFIQSWNTQVGQDLLSWFVLRADELFTKMYDLKATEEEIIEFQIIKRFTMLIYTKIQNHDTAVSKVLEMISNNRNGE